jgi:hypothetical protein
MLWMVERADEVASPRAVIGVSATAACMNGFPDGIDLGRIQGRQEFTPASKA